MIFALGPLLFKQYEAGCNYGGACHSAQEVEPAHKPAAEFHEVQRSCYGLGLQYGRSFIMLYRLHRLPCGALENHAIRLLFDTVVTPSVGLDERVGAVGIADKRVEDRVISELLFGFAHELIERQKRRVGSGIVAWHITGFVLQQLSAERWRFACRISSSLRAGEFNDVASQYMERPTFATVHTFSDGNTALRVEMDEYGTGYDPNLKIVTPHVTYFDKHFVADYVPMIDKYLEWEELATQRGDLIERLVGDAKTWGNGAEVTLKLEIFSSASATHLLVIKRCAVGTCSDKSLSLTKPNAIILRSLLTDFASGKVDQKNLDSIYQ